MNKCIISDLDACIANTYDLENRCMESGVFDTKLFGEECGSVPVDEHLMNMIHTMRGIGNYDLYIVTARPMSLENTTLNWLSEHNIEYSGLYMNDETESVLFKENVLKELSKQYDVCLAIDDKANYIDMYRKYGIQTWHYTNNTKYNRLE